MSGVFIRTENTKKKKSPHKKEAEIGVTQL
jgi:hypothetical protein